MVIYLRLIACAVFVLIPYFCQAQENSPPCTDTGFRQFDFWLGEWNLTWDEEGKGTNRITRVLDDCVILENFDGGDSMPLRGMSVSTYDTMVGQWRQTWVDNNGTYLDFTGGMQGDEMVLVRTFTREGRELMQRMIFREIKPDALIWDWQRSVDQGKTWELLWQINYHRIK